MKHLVIGASGQVGSALVRELSRRGETVVGTCLEHQVPGLIPLDLRQRDRVASLLRESRPQAVWIPAAMPDVDRCEKEPDRSYAVNVEGPAIVMEAASRHHIPVVYFSSDYVFDGVAGPYYETDAVNPLQTYGQHKVAAETRLLPYEGSLIVRPAWIYSDEPNPRNFVFRILSDLKAGRLVQAAVDQWNTPTPADALAAHAVDALMAGYRGILHLTGPERMTRYDLVERIALRAGYAAARIAQVRLSDLTLPAQRPANGGLRTNISQFAIEERLDAVDFRQLLTGP